MRKLNRMPYSESEQYLIRNLQNIVAIMMDSNKVLNQDITKESIDIRQSENLESEESIDIIHNTTDKNLNDFTERDEVDFQVF